VNFPTPSTVGASSAFLSYPLFGGGPTATYFAVASAKKGLEKAVTRLTIRERFGDRGPLKNSYANFAGHYGPSPRAGGAFCKRPGSEMTRRTCVTPAGFEL